MADLLIKPQAEQDQEACSVGGLLLGTATLRGWDGGSGLRLCVDDDPLRAALAHPLEPAGGLHTHVHYAWRMHMSILKTLHWVILRVMV